MSEILIDINFTFTSYGYVHWHCSIDDCFKLTLVDENLFENHFYFTLKWFLLNFFGEMRSRVELQIEAKTFKNWERPLYEIWKYAFKGWEMDLLFALACLLFF